MTAGLIDGSYYFIDVLAGIAVARGGSDLALARARAGKFTQLVGGE